jgi:MFS family permease
MFSGVNKEKLHIGLLNAGHFFDHLTTLVFATVAAVALNREWGMTYAQLIAYATPGFVSFALFSLPAGRIADRWSREGMMTVYFIGLGLASIVTAMARSPLEISIGLFVLGMFAAIYHPVGLALLVQGRARTGMTIAVNGVFGNLGVGSAALLTGYFIDNGGWRLAFVVPGVICILLGVAYYGLMRPEIAERNAHATRKDAALAATRGEAAPVDRSVFFRLSAIIFFTAAVSSLIFQSTTFALPKIFDERLQSIVGSATQLGWIAFLVFAVASLAQLVTGASLDRFGPRKVFIVAALVQTVFFALMPGLFGWPALIVAFCFMFGAFGQVPITDYLIGRMAKSELRAQVYGARYVLSFAVMSMSLPFLAWVHSNWGFDRLFQLLAICAGAILIAVTLLPRRMPDEAPAPATQPVRA